MRTQHLNACRRIAVEGHRFEALNCSNFVQNETKRETSQNCHTSLVDPYGLCWVGPSESGGLMTLMDRVTGLLLGSRQSAALFVALLLIALWPAFASAAPPISAE